MKKVMGFPVFVLFCFAFLYEFNLGHNVSQTVTYLNRAWGE